ncbi:Ref family recombination enhancement nuclease [Pandoraea pnomenusa]|uniref:Ref family recombination enhancement nuclease n=1 Tax=Pandoraea pnomenusa TaxID=93220 RepID=UPI0033405DCC
MSLARKSQMQRGAPLKRSAFKKSSRPRAKKAEREHMGIVAGLSCIVCRNLGFGESPAEVHHVRFLAGGAQRSGHTNTIPLCPLHHRIGGYGVAFHAGPAEFQRRYGTEEQLLEQTRCEMAHRLFAAIAPEVA